MIRRPPSSPLFPSTTLFRSTRPRRPLQPGGDVDRVAHHGVVHATHRSHVAGDDLTGRDPDPRLERSEEHTSELQSRQYLVCRLLLEKKKTSGSEPVPVI